MSQSPQIFESVIETNKGSIFRICRIYAVSPLEPEDLFQEVIFQAWRSFSSYKSKAAVSTWLYRVALNVCMNSKLKHERKNSHTVHLDAILFTKHEQVKDEHSDRFNALKACINDLNDADKSLVILYLEDLAYREIAEISGLTENHVAVKMKRIRSRLFDCITQKLES